MEVQPIRVMLIDDHAILLDGIEMLLQSGQGIDVVGKHASGEDLLADEEVNTCDVIVLDINLKGKDGITTFSELKAQDYSGECIFLSSYNDLKLVNEAMKLGAKGYVTKSSATDCLEMAIKQVAKGQKYYSPDLQEKILTSFGGETQKDDDQIERGMLRQLTEREVDVLKLIAQEYTSDEIAKKLYIAKSTVDTHRKNLINKLQVKNAVGLGLFAERNGLI